MHYSTHAGSGFLSFIPPRTTENRFRVEGVHNLSEGGLTHIIEKMWVGFGQYTGGFTSIADYLCMMVHYLSLQSILDIYELFIYDGALFITSVHFGHL